MRLTTTFTTALVLAMSAGAVACADSGGSHHSDADGDHTSDAKDLCPGTPAMTMTAPDGCAAGEDGDHDGLTTGEDLCAGTAAGAKVDAFGCSAEQRDAGLGAGILYGPQNELDRPANDSASSGSTESSSGDVATGTGTTSTAEESAAIIRNPPATGTVTNGYVALVIDQDSSRPFVFHTFGSNVSQTDEGFAVHGALLLATPLGELPIANASVTFAYGADRSQGLKTVRGDASVPFPSFGAAQGFTADDLVSASLGFDSGKNLASLDAPLNDDRHYLFFHLTAGVSLSSGPLSLSLPGGGDATLVLDPFDPFVFARGSLLGLAALGKVASVGIGISAQGLIPFHATTTRGLAQGMDDFKGALYLSGSVPLGRLPLTLTGETVLDVDPNADGRALSEIDQAGFQLGVNGELDLTADFLDVLSFDANLSDCSAELRVTGDDQRASFSGVLEPDQSWLPKELPLHADVDVNMAGVLSSNLEDSFLTADGKYHLVGSTLTQRVGVDISDLALVDAHLDIDRTGFHLTAKVKAGAKLAKDLELGAGATVKATFGDDPADFDIDIKGDMKVAGVSLLSGHAEIDDRGLHVSGKLDTGIAHVAVSGEITKHGAELTGETGVTIDVKTGKDVLETITDGSICGYEYVKDGALCGYEVVTDGAKCGYALITDGVQCGYPIVTDGAQCGYKIVTNAALCGTHEAEDVGECVASTVCGWFSWAGCSTSYDCTVANSCEDLGSPKSCPDLSQPNSCNDLIHPRSCEDLTQPKSCEDLSQPKTCEHHHVIPDFEFGTFEGKVSVTLGSQGVGGEVSGSYCPTSGSCQKLAGGEVKIGKEFEACIDAPANLGEFCTRF